MGEITDKNSVEYQKIAWAALEKSIHDTINKVNTSNIEIMAREILKLNIERGRGLLCKSIIQAQSASPTFTNVYAALVAVIDCKSSSKLTIGALLVRRLVLQFKKGFRENNKVICMSATTFMAHLVNQNVVHVDLIHQILTFLLVTPTEDFVEVALSILKECGQKIIEKRNKYLDPIFDILRLILHKTHLEHRIQDMIEVMLQMRENGFKDHPAVIKELDLVHKKHQDPHFIALHGVKKADSEDTLDVFKFDVTYEKNEDLYKYKETKFRDFQSGAKDKKRKKYRADSKIIDINATSLKALERHLTERYKESSDRDILESLSDPESSTESESTTASESSCNDSESESDIGSGDEDEEETSEKEDREESKIVGNTATNLTALRQTIDSTIQSSVDFEETANKLIKIKLETAEKIELCHILCNCCAEQKTYLKINALIAQRFCQVDQIYMKQLQNIFKKTYSTAQQLDNYKLKNVGRFFAYLLFTDAIGWQVLKCITLKKKGSNISKWIFIVALFQELEDLMGLEKLNAKLKDSNMHPHLFRPKFSVTFFTIIGLGDLVAEFEAFRKSAKTNRKRNNCKCGNSKKSKKFKSVSTQS